MKINKTYLLLNDSGMAAIIITMIMSIVITSIALGFSQVAVNEQKSSLANALSTQAYYAAESGINDAVYQLSKNSSYTGNCSNIPSNQILNNSNQVEYTCLSVNSTPTSLIYDVPPQSPLVIGLDTSKAPNSLNISWQNKALSSSNDYTSTDCGAQNNFVSNKNYNCGASVLQFSVMRQITGTYSPNNMSTIFLHPNDAINSPINLINTGSDNLVACNNNGSPYDCKVSIDVSQYCHNTTTPYCYIEIIPLDSESILSISAQANVLSKGGPRFRPGPSKSTVTFNNTQAQIDSTGKALDQLKRVLATISISNTQFKSGVITNAPEFALQTGNTICKQIEYLPGNNTTIVPGPDSTNPSQCGIN